MPSENEVIFINTVLTNVDRVSSYLSKKSHLEELFHSNRFTLNELYQSYDSVKEHSLAVCELASKIANRVYSPQVKKGELSLHQVNKLAEDVEMSALYHDVAKLTFPSHFLNRDIELDRDELNFARRYPLVSYYMLYDIPKSETVRLKNIFENILFHREKFNGGGPAEEFYNCTRGKRKGDEGYIKMNGEKIPLAARILAVADTCDAMRRRGETLQRVRQELRDQAGREFDPNIVDICLDILLEEELRAASRKNN
ncbi:HD domain-containing protein [Candidatus Woesearchaeota archaeon]|nr:HD domain-containing protein [Candidatus Woesearchaeota archaeon]